jgi:hypothetical protein
MSFHQGLWKVPDPPNRDVEPGFKAGFRLLPQRERPKKPTLVALRHTVAVRSENVVDIPPQNFWDAVNLASSDRNFVVSISSDLIRDRSEGSTLSLYENLVRPLLTLVCIS